MAIVLVGVSVGWFMLLVTVLGRPSFYFGGGGGQRDSEAGILDSPERPLWTPVCLNDAFSAPFGVFSS